MWGVMTVAFSQCNSVMQGYIFWGKPCSAMHGRFRYCHCSAHVPVHLESAEYTKVCL